MDFLLITISDEQVELQRLQGDQGDILHIYGQLHIMTDGNWCIIAKARHNAHAEPIENSDIVINTEIIYPVGFYFLNKLHMDNEVIKQRLRST